MQEFDYIIIGAGCAGLSLAWHLLQSGSQAQVLIIESAAAKGNDRTWGYWSAKSGPFDPLASVSFQQAAFLSNTFEATLDMEPYVYRVIRSEDYYQFIKKDLAQHSQFSFLHAKAGAVQHHDDHATVKVDNKVFKAGYIFDSRFDGPAFAPGPKFLNLKQHFMGYVIKIKAPVFENAPLRLFDFRVPQDGKMRFMYIIPYDAHTALVEYTLFSAELLSQVDYKRAIEVYIKDTLSLKEDDFQIEETEFGVIPMSNYPFWKDSNGRHIKIGSAGGSSKASTGYTFLRIQRHMAALAKALVNGDKVKPYRPAFKYQLYDSIMLDVIQRHGGSGAQVFTDLFRHNKAAEIFRFLDEDTTFAEDLKIMASVPPLLFLKSLIHVALNQLK